MRTNKSFVDSISAFRCNNNNSCQTWNFIWHTHAHHGAQTRVFVSDIYSHSRHRQMNSPWMFTLRSCWLHSVRFFRGIFVVDEAVICIHQIVPSGEDLMMMLFSLGSVNISRNEKHSQLVAGHFEIEKKKPIWNANSLFIWVLWVVRAVIEYSTLEFVYVYSSTQQFIFKLQFLPNYRSANRAAVPRFQWISSTIKLVYVLDICGIFDPDELAESLNEAKWWPVGACTRRQFSARALYISFYMQMAPLCNFCFRFKLCTTKTRVER